MASEPPQRWLPRAGETPRDTLARLCAELRHATGAERVGAWLHVVEAGVVVPLLAVPDRIPNAVRRRPEDLRIAGQPLLHELIEERRQVEVADPAGDPRVPEAFRTDEDVRPFRAVPLGDDPVCGVLTVEPAGVELEPVEEMLPFIAAALAQAGVWRRAEVGRRRAELLHDVVEAGSKGSSLDDVLVEVCERLAAGLDARRASIFLVGADGELRPRMSRFADARRDDAQWGDFIDPQVPFRLGRRVLDSGDAIALSDTEAPSGGWSDEDQWWIDRFDIASAGLAPIADGETAHGVLVVDSPHQGRFGREDVRLLGAVGAQLAMVIERAGYADALEERVRAETAMRYVLEGARSAEDVRQAAEVLARVAHDTLAVEHTVVYLRDADGRVSDLIPIDVPEPFEQMLREMIADRPDAVAGYLNRMLEPGVVLVDDARESDLLPPEFVEALHLLSYASLPILAPDRPLGIIECGTTRSVRRWTDADRRLVEQLALEGSLVLEAAALREADRRRLEELSHQAFHDELTRLPNRALLMDRIEHALARAERNPEEVAVLFVDLDRFKPVNDRLGHAQGDRILIEVARRIESSVRPGDTVARLAGDEFVVVLEDIGDRDEASQVATRVVEELNRPYDVAGELVAVTASVGIALGAPGEVSAEELIRRADTAMYRVKAGGGGAYDFHDVLGGTPLAERAELGRDLVGAVDRDEMRLRYQAIYDLEDRSIVAIEALVRWDHPRLGMIGPETFLAIAEEAGEIREIAEWVMRTVCDEVSTWWREEIAVAVAVNLSSRLLYSGAAHDLLGRCLEASGLPPIALLVEVGERAVVQDVEAAIDALARIRDLGVRTVLDDFGSGNASLRDVQRLPLDVLKMDPSIVDGVEGKTGNVALVRAIVDVAENLDLVVIAEGIETDEQVAALRRIGCRFGQGYLLHRPSESGKIRALLGRQKQAGSVSASSLG